MAGTVAALIWPQVWVYHPLMGLVLALFFSLSIRFFLLFFLEGDRGVSARVFHLIAGVACLALGWFYLTFAWPLLVWDRPTRAAVALTAAVIVLWTLARHGAAPTGKISRFVSTLLKFSLFVALLLVATLTIIRTGYIALTGHRVTLLVNVTGETRSQTVGWTSPEGVARQETFIAHHVIITLPSGQAAADVWLYGDALAVHGKVVRFSERLHQLGMPFLYELQFVHNDYSSPQRKFENPPQVITFPNSGALAVNGWWRPVQRRLLNYLADRGEHGFWWGISISGDDTPDYPLVDPGGGATHQLFLLIIHPWGATTSRGSSPLEDKYKSRR